MRQIELKNRVIITNIKELTNKHIGNLSDELDFAKLVRKYSDVLNTSFYIDTKGERKSSSAILKDLKHRSKMNPHYSYLCVFFESDNYKNYVESCKVGIL